MPPRARHSPAFAEFKRAVAEQVQSCGGDGFLRALRVMEPCAGLACMEELVKDTDIMIEPDIWETEAKFMEYYQAKFGNRFTHERFHVGAEAGDFTQAEFANIHFCPDAIQAGPPCTPWAPNGMQLGVQDPRAQVYISCVAAIIYFAQRGSFIWSR